MKTVKTLAVLVIVAGCVPPEGQTTTATPGATAPAPPPQPAVPIFEQSSDPLDVNLSDPPTIICDESLPLNEQIAGCIRTAPREGVSSAPLMLPGSAPAGLAVTITESANAGGS